MCIYFIILRIPDDSITERLTDPILETLLEMLSRLQLHQPTWVRCCIWRSTASARLTFSTCWRSLGFSQFHCKWIFLDQHKFYETICSCGTFVIITYTGINKPREVYSCERMVLSVGVNLRVDFYLIQGLMISSHKNGYLTH